MVVAAFLVTDQANKVRLFEKTFLIANVSPDVVLVMLFFILSDADVGFPKGELQWRSYIIQEAFLTIKQVKLIRKKEFAATALDLGYETFVVYIAFFESLSQESDVLPFCRV